MLQQAIMNVLEANEKNRKLSKEIERLSKEIKSTEKHNQVEILEPKI